MEITTQAVRVYGTRDQFGAEPFMVPPGTPLELTDYPRGGDHAVVHFGAVPEFALDAYRTRRALGALLLQGIARDRELEGMSPEEVVAHFRASDVTAFDPEDCKFLTTITIARIFAIEDVDLTDRPHFWLSVAAVRRLDGELRAEFGQYLDHIASIVASSGESGLLTRRLVDDLYFMAEGRPPIAFPKLTLSATASVGRGMDRLPLDRIRELLHRLPSVGKAARTFDTARSLYLAAKHETDPWKKFLWCFSAVEILARKLGSRHHKDVVSRLRLANDPAIDASVLLPLVQTKTNLVADFTVMALQLAPATAGEDLTEFRRAKKVRDQLSHGGVIEAGALPIGETMALADRYIHLSERS